MNAYAINIFPDYCFSIKIGLQFKETKLKEVKPNAGDFPIICSELDRSE